MPGRKVTYKLLRPDFFVITGESGTNSFYVRYAGNETAVRGFTFRYPTAKQKVMDRYVIAAANTFEPFPGAAPANDPAAETVGKKPAPPKQVEVKPAEPQFRYETAIAVDGGLVTVGEALTGCNALMAGNATLSVAPHPVPGLAALSGAGAAAPLPLRATPPVAGESVVAIYAGSEGAMLAPGQLVAGKGGLAIEAAIQTGGRGAAVLDRKGRLIGLVADDPSALKPIAGSLPSGALPSRPLAEPAQRMTARPISAPVLWRRRLRPAPSASAADFEQKKGDRSEAPPAKCRAERMFRTPVRRTGRGAGGLTEPPGHRTGIEAT